MPLKQELIETRKILNIIHSLIIILGTALLLCLAAYLIYGVFGILFVLFVWITTVFLVSILKPNVIAKLYNARKVNENELPKLYALVNILSEKADLEKAPDVYYIPYSEPIILSASLKDNAAIAVSGGMLQLLDYDEMYGVLAHEISHIKNRDIWVMQITDIASRLATFVAYIGQVLMIVLLPVLLDDLVFFWMLFIVLAAIPPITKLMQLSLSRVREYAADLDSVMLTGSPKYLINALYKINSIEESVIYKLFNPFYKPAEPSLLRTHPSTKNRIKKLNDLEEDRLHEMASFMKSLDKR
jgi:heat shock protein HtpX